MRKSFNISQAWKYFEFGPVKSEEKSSPKTPQQSKISESTDISFENPKVVKVAPSNSKMSSFDFHSRLSPKNVSDLAVHHKKIEEVKNWLERVFLNETNKRTSFLLLSGPTGSGKTATLCVLCKNMDISISEWLNPVDQDFELVRGPNQVNRFLEFITTESNYNSLFEVTSERRIVLVKDFPNVFMRNHDEFLNILEECYYKSKYPIVFICTEVANSKINLVYNLFPQEVLDKYEIAQISFNACASTLLKGALKRAHDLVQKNRSMFHTPPQSVVEAISSSSMGDIRCAINQYYFACLLGSKVMPTENTFTPKPGAKRKRSIKSSSIKIMAKDETLGLFHALGRILNPKRKEHNKSWRINCDLESLIMELSSQPESVVSFLFTNYIKYFGDLKELQQASDLICLSQKFFDKWSERYDHYQYALWISVLGLMTMNSHKVSKWNQIEGPKKTKKYILRTPETLSSLDEYYITVIKKPNKMN